jgi:hypothetical protein
MNPHQSILVKRAEGALMLIDIHRLTGGRKAANGCSLKIHRVESALLMESTYS